MTTKSDFQTMSDGFELWVTKWIPDEVENIKGVVQLHHGLAEHSLRYDRLGSVLCENGYVLVAYDMRGHGRTAENAEKKGKGGFGKLADNDGFNRVVEDLHEMIEADKKEFAGKKVFLLGHSFGSFVSQGFIEKYSTLIDGCILCGTAGPMGAVINCGCLISALVKAVRGGDSYSKLLPKLSFGSYNKRISNKKTDMDWLSANEMNIQMYQDDKWCGIPLRTSFFYDMTHALKMIHKGSNIKKISNDLPIFFIYGSEDPVGSYGATIKKLYNIYKTNGIKKLAIKSYEGDRHEIFNENDKDIVEKDVIEWFDGILK